MAFLSIFDRIARLSFSRRKLIAPMAIFSGLFSYTKEQGPLTLRFALIYFIICLAALTGSFRAHAQKKGTSNVNPARQHALDSTRTAQKHFFDSLKIARQLQTDSIKKSRQRVTDSLVRIRKYRESKKYQDSVAQVKKERINQLQAERKVHTDSLKAIRQKTLDSTIATRRAITAVVQARQKKRTDSLAAIRKYKESKRYKDSTILARTHRLDSIKQVRQEINDSISLARKLYNDSANLVRKLQFDSVAGVRKRVLDSMKAIRQVKADSLAKVKAKRQKTQEARAKEREQKQQLAFELKIKKKREAWSNEKMLKKKWGVPRQIVQNTFTRYNYYFNSDRKMDEALENMQRLRKENYDSTLALFPFDPDRDSAVLASDMDSIIQKASVGIQIHDPRTKWGDDLYLLLGQAYYYKGDYENASTAFKYIVYLNEQNKKKSGGRATSTPSRTVGKAGKDGKKTTQPSIAEAENKSMLDFLKHRSVHNEALLWLTRTYTEAHQEGSAESVLDLLETDPNLPKSLAGRLAVEKSYLSLSERDHKKAIEQLAIVADDKGLPHWLRQRAAYIDGQLLTDRGDYTAAATSFQKVIDLNPKIDMDFYARKNLAYSLMYAGGNQDDAVASLKRVLNDGKYSPYYEQVYYVMGRLAANGSDKEEAIGYLKKGISSPKSTKKQKALSFAALGGVYYDMHNYVAAKNAYDSASALGGSTNDSLIMLAKRRSLALDEVTGPFGVIHTQDSLLALAGMSEKEQYTAIRKYIRHLQSMKEDSAFRAENQGIANASQNNTDASANSSNGGTNYANWYFSNPTLMQQGINDFKRKWGSRTLTDNWRRSAAVSFASNKSANNDAGATTAGDDGVTYDENGLPTEESLLALIPNTAERKEQALKRIRRAYVDLGTAYIQQLEDYPQANRALDTFDTRFPNNEHKAEVLYLRYLISLRQNNLPAAKSYASQLQGQFADTKWAMLVRPPEDNNGELQASNNTNVANYYDETYGLLLQRQYPEVLKKIREGQRMYTDPRYLKRFRIIEAIASVGVSDYDRADTLVTDFIAKNPTDSLRRWADAVLDYIKKNRPAAAPPAAAAAAANNPAVPSKILTPPAAGAAGADAKAAGKVPPPSAADMALADAPVSKPAPAPPANFAYNPQEEHYVVFSFKSMEQRSMGVKAAISDFNTFKFGSLNLDSKAEMISPDQGVIVTRKFNNAGQAKIYLNSLKGTAQVFREYRSDEYQLFIISASNYLKVAADKSLQAYMSFYKSHY